MKCAIDFSAITVGAGVTYARNLLRSLARIDRENEYVVLLPGRELDLGVELSANFRSLRVPRIFRGPAVRAALAQFWLPIWTKRNSVGVLFAATDYSAPLVHCPIVLGIHNLNPYEGPPASTLSGRARERAIRILAGLSARRAAAVFFVSEAARSIIARRLRMDLSKTHVIHCGVGWEFFEDGKMDRTVDSPGWARFAEIRRPYILSVSTVRSHKDFATLVLAFSRLIASHPIPHQLVIAGPIVDPPYYRRLRQIVAGVTLPGQVVFLGEVSHRDIPGLYRGADVTVLPSWAETFGMPLAEALACGIPTVASDIPALREVGGEAALYYKPGNPDDLTGVLSLLMRDPALQERLQSAGRIRARDFSWERAAEKTHRLLVAAACGPPRDSSPQSR